MAPIRILAVAVGVALASGVVAAPLAAALEPVAAPAGYQRLVDDSGNLSIHVPVARIDVVTQSVDVNGTDVPAVAATPPGSGFPNSVLASGALLFAFSYTSDPVAIAEVFAPDGCQGPTIEPFQNGALTGVVHRFTACGGTAEQTVVAANPAGKALTGVCCCTSPRPSASNPCHRRRPDADAPPISRP